jgi:hypothetical protein
MDYDDVVDMMICYLIIFVSIGAIDWFLLSVQDSEPIEDVDGIDGPPWTLDRVRSGLFMVDDRLLIRLTFGVKGSCTTTRDIEGEVWQQPCHNLLALSSWLEL